MEPAARFHTNIGNHEAIPPGTPIARVLAGRPIRTRAGGLRGGPFGAAPLADAELGRPLRIPLRSSMIIDMRVRKESTARSDRDAAAYTLAEAARYVRLPLATLRSWALGREYPTVEGGGQFPPLIRPASRRPPLLSFSNLIEAHVLRSLRTEHGVSVKALRKALAYAERTLDIDRLLLRPECIEAGNIFLDRYGEVIRSLPRFRPTCDAMAA